MVPIDQSDQYAAAKNTNQDLLQLYHDAIDNMHPSFWEVLQDRPKLKFDVHPSPMDHLYYLDQVLPEFKIAQSTRLQAQQETAIIQQADYCPPDYKKPTIQRA